MKNKKISYADFIKQLKKKKIKLLPDQKELAKLIIDNKNTIHMAPRRSGKTWLFKLIDDYLSDESEYTLDEQDEKYITCMNCGEVTTFIGPLCLPFKCDYCMKLIDHLKPESYSLAQSDYFRKTKAPMIRNDYLKRELAAPGFMDRHPHILIPEPEEKAPIIDDIILVYLQKLEKLHEEERKVIIDVIGESRKPIPWILPKPE